MRDTSAGASKTDLVFVILHESVLDSWLKDAGTFGSLAALVYINHAYAGGSWLVDAVAAIAVISFMVRVGLWMMKRSPRFTRSELRAWVLSGKERP